jgi:hypothetical protein
MDKCLAQCAIQANTSNKKDNMMWYKDTSTEMAAWRIILLDRILHPALQILILSSLAPDTAPKGPPIFATLQLGNVSKARNIRLLAD